MIVLRDKLLQLILNEKERVKDMEKVGLIIGAGDYYRLLQSVKDIHKDLENKKKKRKLFKL